MNGVAPGSLLVLVAACVGPNLVTVPILESTPVKTTAAHDEDPRPSSEPGEEVSLGGTWEGRAWQAGNKSWSLSVTFERSTRSPSGSELVAHVSYPDQRCRADWKLKASDGRHWTGEETITNDPLRRCPDRGRVVLDIIDEDTLSWRWSRGSDSATATLEHAQP